MSAVRVALTQTTNAFSDMPRRVEDLTRLEGRLEEIRSVNVDHHVALMRAAKSQRVRVIGFGELFAGPYFALGKNPLWFGLAEDALTGPSVRRIAEEAKALEMIVVAPIYELDPSGRRFNTAVVIDEQGQVIGRYRKVHLPRGSNEQGSFDEPFYYDKSDGQNGTSAANVSENPFFPVFQTSAGRIGIAICYDRHFEGVMHTLAYEGAEIVFSPAVTFGQKSQRMWHLEFQVDAARHNVFIAGSNRSGAEPPWNQPYFGQSYITGPNGVLSNLSTHQNLIVSDVDLEELSRPDPAGWDLPRDMVHGRYSKRGC